MMVLAIFSLLSWQQAPVAAAADATSSAVETSSVGDLNRPDPIWVEIAGLEQVIKKSIRNNDSQFVITSSDPVQGYYIPNTGAMLIIPVRYRPAAAGMLNERAQADAPTETVVTPNAATPNLNRRDLQRRVQEWQRQLDRNEMLKEANFEKVVDNMRKLTPELLGRLGHLPESEALVMVIEERMPAWYYAGFSLKKNATRKIVTLTVDKAAISNIDANTTVMDGEWLSAVRRTTINRKLISGALEGSQTVD